MADDVRVHSDRCWFTTPDGNIVVQFPEKRLAERPAEGLVARIVFPPEWIVKLDPLTILWSMPWDLDILPDQGGLSPVESGA